MFGDSGPEKGRGAKRICARKSKLIGGRGLVVQGGKKGLWTSLHYRKKDEKGRRDWKRRHLVLPYSPESLGQGDQREKKRSRRDTISGEPRKDNNLKMKGGKVITCYQDLLQYNCTLDLDLSGHYGTIKGYTGHDIKT